MQLLRYAKAFAGAAAAAAVTAAGAALADGSISQGDAYTIVVAAFAAGVAVFLTPNKPAATR